MKKTIAVTVVLCLACPIFADTDPCAQTYVITASAVANRDKGLTQDQLRRPLPSREAADKNPDSPASIKLLLMHQVVDEIYIAPQVDAQTFATYKAEQCYRRLVKKPTPTNFQLVVPLLMECAQLQEKAKIVCAMEAAGSDVKNDAR